MANYIAKTRTNYFHVKDVDAAKEVLNHLFFSERKADVWTDADQNGEVTFAFGGDGMLKGIIPEGVSPYDCDDDSIYEEAICALQSIVADNDAIIIMEVGHERMRYLIGRALIVTKEDTGYVDMQNVVTQEAAQMLKNPNWSTKCDY